MYPPVYYSEYLQLDKILDAQQPKSELYNVKANDEMLFIVIHQTYELWFKQILFEVELVRQIFCQEDIDDNKADLSNAVHRLHRVTQILEILVGQITILETMTPLDFLDFRDFLRPASGFQSIQFKILEAALGLRYQDRFGHHYYLSQLSQADIDRVKEAETKVSLLELLNQWLERMPFLQNSKFWNTNGEDLQQVQTHPFWQQYRQTYSDGLLASERNNQHGFDLLLWNDEQYPAERRLSPKANRHALFIMLYRDCPLLHAPYQLLNTLLDIDDLLAQWRYRHINMVGRMIGKRIGTGGSTGAEYLQSAAQSHYIFKELAELTSYLVQRNHLPTLSPELQRALGYVQW